MNLHSIKLITKGERKDWVEIKGQPYRPYLIGELPKKFAYIYDEMEDREGLKKWFNFRGYTYIRYESSNWG